MLEQLALSGVPLFAGRQEAGRALADELEAERGPDLVVVGLARGGVVVAAEVARALSAPLDVLAVRKVGHPLRQEYALGAATPGDGVYLRDHAGLDDAVLAAIVAETKAKAARLDRHLHAAHPALDLRGKVAVVVDDGIATGATMIAALRRARAAGAVRTVAAAPVAAPESVALLCPEAEAVVCLHAPRVFFAVGFWYARFAPVDDQRVIRLLAVNRREAGRQRRPSLAAF